jgi:hypothetical protein
LVAVPDKQNFKIAAEYLLIAAGLFEKIRVEKSNLKPCDLGLDFTEQNLLMCSYIMQGQAAYAKHEKILLEAPDKLMLFAKIAYTTSAFYGKAYSLAVTPPMSKSVDPRNTTSLLQFHERAFMALAYYWKGMLYEKQCSMDATGIGQAIANVTRAVEVISELNKIEKLLSPAVLTQLHEVNSTYTTKLAYLKEQNKKIYHENVPAPEEIEAMNTGQPTSVDKDLTQSIEGLSFFGRLVPGPVRALDEEYKNEVQTILNELFQKNGDFEAGKAAILAKHNLPNCLYAVSDNKVLPDDLWGRIKKCKEQGGVRSLEEMGKGLSKMSESNQATIDRLNRQLREEENEDQAQRAIFGSRWSRTPSANLNQGMKKQVEYYTQKHAQALGSDSKLQEMVARKKEEMSMLDLDKADLIRRIPAGRPAELRANPAAVE